MLCRQGLNIVCWSHYSLQYYTLPTFKYTWQMKYNQLGDGYIIVNLFLCQVFSFVMLIFILKNTQKH